MHIGVSLNTTCIMEISGPPNTCIELELSEVNFKKTLVSMDAAKATKFLKCSKELNISSHV